MLCRYWSEVDVVNADKTILVATVKPPSLSSAMLLVRETQMAVYAACIQVSLQVSRLTTALVYCLVSCAIK